MKRDLPPFWLLNSFLVVLLTLLEATLAWAEPDNRSVPIPANLEVSEPLRTVLRTMWHRSSTFRAQCARIERAPSLLVVLRFGTGTPVGRGRARTEFVVSNGRVIRPQIRIRAEIHVEWGSRSLVELIAHELEHVIEQLDGVQLIGGSQEGVFRGDDGAFETARAIHIGEKVDGEVRWSQDAILAKGRQ